MISINLLEDDLDQENNVITIVDFDVFLEKNNLSSESFYSKTDTSSSFLNSQKNKYLKFQNGVLVREKTSTVNSFIGSNNNSILKLKKNDVKNNVPISFKKINSNLYKDNQVNNFHQKDNIYSNNQINGNSSKPVYNCEYSTDYSYSYYPKKKNQSESELIKNIHNQNISNISASNQKVINSVFLNSVSYSDPSVNNKYFNLKDEENEKISKKIKKSSNYSNSLLPHKSSLQFENNRNGMMSNSNISRPTLSSKRIEMKSGSSKNLDKL